MKTFTAIAALAAASTVTTLDGEFMRGAQTGMFIRSEEQFEEYSCPSAAVSPQIKQMLDMAMPMKMMAQNMNQGQPNPLLDAAFEGMQLIGEIQDLFDEEYDGGEFCRGLVFAKEASTVVFKIGNQMRNGSKNEASEAVNQKTLSMEEKFRRV